MKAQKMIEVRACDVPNCLDDAWISCDLCGKDFCSTHSKEKIVEYRQSLYFIMGSDPRYCVQCNESLIKAQNPKILAFLEVKKLIDELRHFNEYLEKRRKIVEEGVKKYV